LAPGAWTATEGTGTIANAYGFWCASDPSIATEAPTPINQCLRNDGTTHLGGVVRLGNKLTLYNNAAPTDGQLLIGGTAAGDFTAGTLTGTTNRVTVTNGNNSVTLSAPQDLHTGAAFQVASLGLGTAADATSGTIKGVVGVSTTTTAAKNLRGSCTFAAATTCSVSFGTAEPDTSYFIVLGCNANKTFWWSSKAMTGFTLNVSASSSDTCDWVLVR
jgi:hypothetical protein